MSAAGVLADPFLNFESLIQPFNQQAIGPAKDIIHTPFYSHSQPIIQNLMIEDSMIKAYLVAHAPNADTEAPEEDLDAGQYDENEEEENDNNEEEEEEIEVDLEDK